MLTAYFVMPVIRNSVWFRYTQTALPGFLPVRGGPAPAPALRGECRGVMKLGREARNRRGALAVAFGKVLWLVVWLYACAGIAAGWVTHLTPL